MSVERLMDVDMLTRQSGDTRGHIFFYVMEVAGHMFITQCLTKARLRMEQGGSARHRNLLAFESCS